MEDQPTDDVVFIDQEEANKVDKIKKPRKPLSEEQKETRRMNLAKAREVKKQYMLKAKELIARDNCPPTVEVLKHTGTHDHSNHKERSHTRTHHKSRPSPVEIEKHTKMNTSTRTRHQKQVDRSPVTPVSDVSGSEDEYDSVDDEIDQLPMRRRSSKKEMPTKREATHRVKKEDPKIKELSDKIDNLLHSKKKISKVATIVDQEVKREASKINDGGWF